MPFLVRKLMKRDKLTDLEHPVDISELNADIATTEFRTTNGNLSTWFIASLEQLSEAVLAVAITSSKIEKMDFIIIDTDWLGKNSLEYKQTPSGTDMAVPELENSHCDIVGITTPKLCNCIQLYLSVVKADPEHSLYIIRKTRGEIMAILKKAKEEKRINAALVNKNVREVLETLKIG